MNEEERPWLNDVISSPSTDTEQGDEDELFFWRYCYHFQHMFSKTSCPHTTIINMIKEHGVFWMKERYILYQKIYRKLISLDVKIFGGFVRDTLIHRDGAKQYYNSEDFKKSIDKKKAYCDPSVDPSSFLRRNTYPNDIDCFISDAMQCDITIQEVCKCVMGLTVKSCSSNSGYSRHPLFVCNYDCKTYTLEYIYNNSLQHTGEKINIIIDMVYSKQGCSEGPWSILIDAACNMLYIDKTGIHSAFEITNDVFEDRFRTESIIKLLLEKKTFIAPINSYFQNPVYNDELYTIQSTRNFTYAQASTSFDKSPYSYKSLYRLKYIQRVAKLVHEGWNVLNLNIKFTDNTSSINGEEICSISHEDLQGKFCVQLGVTNNDKWSQTSIMTWSSFCKYLFQPIDARKDAWSIVCPVSKSVIKTTEHLPIDAVIKQALSR